MGKAYDNKIVYREMQAEVAGFCLSTFFSIILFLAGHQLFQDGSAVKVLWGIICWGSGLTFVIPAAYCCYSLYMDISEQIKRSLGHIPHKFK